MKKVFNTKEYKSFIENLKQRIHSAQYESLKVVNKELINLYRDIDKIITEKQIELSWGKSIDQNAASDLQKAYSGISGFSAANFWKMRNFYLEYKDSLNLTPLVREIIWTKNIVILEKCKENFILK